MRCIQIAVVLLCLMCCLCCGMQDLQDIVGFPEYFVEEARYAVPGQH